MSQDRSQWSLSTKMNHPTHIKLHEGNRPLLQPIYHSAKYTPSENAPTWEQFIYSRVSNPTVRQLELTLAEIQGKEDCLAFGSGIAAITNVFLALLKSGDHLITFREIYKPSRMFVRDILPRYNIENSILSLQDLSKLEAAIIPGKTKLIHFESPSNPNLDIADIDKIISVARKHNVLVMMDATFGGLHQHNQFDIDLVIHSLTKYANGHGDVIAGCISGSKSLIKSIKDLELYFGAALDPQAANLIMRGLKTYEIRYERQTKTAWEVVKYLKSHPKVINVRYPGLPEHQGHELAKKQMKDMGSVIAFEISPDVSPSADKFCHSLDLIQLAASLGSTETIICPTWSFFGTDLSAEDLEQVGINKHTLRMSIGLEHPEDIIRDLARVLG